MTIEYRDAVPGDATAIAALFARIFTDTFGALYRGDDLALFLARADPASFEREIKDPEFAVRVAALGEQLLGFIKLGPPALAIETPDSTIELRQLYILELWQGEGIAAALFDWGVEEARRRGARHIQLSVFVDNHRAKAFYRARGFVVVGRYDFKVGSHADEDIVMRLSL